MSEQLTVFDPFDLCIGARYHDPVLVQDIIDYCAQRFRAIFNYMRDRYHDRDIPIWFNKTMESELVCFYPLTEVPKADPFSGICIELHWVSNRHWHGH